MGEVIDSHAKRDVVHYKHSVNMASMDTASLLAAAKETTERLATAVQASSATGAERDDLKRRLAQAVQEYRALKSGHDSALVAMVSAAERQVLIEQALQAVEKADKINLAFLFDATESMRPHINDVKLQMSSIVQKVLNTSPNVKLQVAFVAYRDHACGSRRFSIQPFTASIPVFEYALQQVETLTVGSGDFPEDVHGGLQQATQLAWDNSSAGTKVLIHIADAPCHGTQYQPFGYHPDHYPAGDPYGLRAADLLSTLSDCQVEYVFGRLNDTTDRMIQTFNLEMKRQYIAVCDISDDASFNVSVVTAARGSMARTASALRAGNGKRVMRAQPGGLGSIDNSWADISAAAAAKGPLDSRRAFTITAGPVNWSHQRDYPVKLYTNDPVISMDQLKNQKSWRPWCRRAAPTNGASPEDLRLQVAPQPFAQGNLRWAFQSRIKLADGWTPGVVKLFKDSSRHMNTRAQYLAQIEVSTVSAFLAEEYNKIKQPQHLPVTFLKSHVVEVSKADGTMEYYNIEPELPPSKQGFIKFSNNTGYWNSERFDPTLALFSQWTYAVTGKYMMVTDLQGVKTATGYYLTDPVVLCHDLSRFGSTNMGPQFIKRCMHSSETLLAEAM
jgi:Alpha-kinase family